MELYTGELLFGTHENLEHLALMDGLFCFTQGEKFVRLKLPQNHNPGGGFKRFFYFHDISCLFGEDEPILTSINHPTRKLSEAPQEASLGGFPSKMLSQATGQPRDKCPGLEPVLKILKGKNWTTG